MSSLTDIFEEARRMEGSLASRLLHYAAGLGQAAPALALAYEAFITRLRAAEAGEGAPKVGEALPPFLLPDQESSLVSSEELIASGPLVVSFNRGHWCSFCKLELLALADLDARVRAAGATLVSITPERAQFARTLRSQTGLGWPVLTDVDLAYTLSLGLAVPVGEELGMALLEADVDLALYQGSSAWFLPIPATFAIGPNGKIAARHVDPDFRNRMEPEAILAALQ
jgi:peroxiredoxin